MKAGAAAAWSVPLVQVVAAAPAFATSGATVSLSGVTGGYTGQSTRTVNLTFTPSTSAFDKPHTVLVKIVFSGGIEGAITGPSDWAKLNATTFSKSFTADATFGSWTQTNLQFVGSRPNGNPRSVTGTVTAEATDSVAGYKQASQAFTVPN
jgi:hypothetical protein